jgi:hypothetical protein
MSSANMVRNVATTLDRIRAEDEGTAEMRVGCGMVRRARVVRNGRIASMKNVGEDGLFSIHFFTVAA